MRCSHAIGMACLFLILALSIDATGQEKTKKGEIPKDAVAGTVKSVDLKKASFTITPDKGKDRNFLVDKATEFWGPQGGDRGTGPKGLEDDCMAVGYEINVQPSKDGKTALNVYLPMRKSGDDKKADDKKADDKKKK